MNYSISDRIATLQPSAIREILKFSSDPSVVPFSAGNPAPEAFPVAEVQQVTADILSSHPVDALQYGVTEGYAPLREQILAWMKESEQIGGVEDEIMITSGAQQVMDLAAKILVNEGDTVLCENPSFIGSLNCFRSYRANLVGVEVEADGMDVNQLEQALKAHPNAKFIYTIPNFQNPTGATMSWEKRKAVYALAKKYQVLIIEDNPYGALRVEGESIPCIKTLDQDGLVIYAGSFSKILSPGLRVGFMIAPKALVAKMTVGKQTSDVHTPVLNQMIVSQWMKQYDVNAHMERIRDIYRKKLNLMCGQIDQELNGFFTYHKPQGGLFVWCRIPDGIDMPAFCTSAVKDYQVAMVPGTAFLTDESAPCQYVRLNFSTPTDEAIVHGVQNLAKLTRQIKR